MKIFANSMPKSGTFLVARLLELLGVKSHQDVFFSQFVVSLNLKAPFFSLSNLKNNYCFFYQNENGVCVDINSLKKNFRQDAFSAMLDTVPDNSFVFAHSGYCEKAVDILERKDFKMLYIIRDPRDVMVSLYNYVLKHKSHFAHRKAKSKSMEDFLKDYMENGFGYMDNFPAIKKLSLKNQLLNSAFWINDKRVFSMRFEDLIGEKGGGDDQKQFLLVKGILNYLELESDDKKIEEVCQDLFSTEARTFSAGQIGSYKKHFSDKLHLLYSQNMKAYGQLVGYN